MQGDWRERLVAIEQRVKRAGEAWDHGDVVTLRQLTLDDVPWLIEGFWLLAEAVEASHRARMRGPIATTISDLAAIDDARRAALDFLRGVGRD